MGMFWVFPPLANPIIPDPCLVFKGVIEIFAKKIPRKILTEHEVILFLSSREAIVREIDRLIKELTTEAYRDHIHISPSSPSYENNGRSTDKKDIHFVYEKFIRDKDFHLLEVKAQIYELTLEIERVEAVWACYKKLPVEDKLILQKMIVEKKPVLSKKVRARGEGEMVNQAKEKAISNLIEAYDQKYS